MKVKNFKRKTHLGKMTLSFACFIVLVACIFCASLYPKAAIAEEVNTIHPYVTGFDSNNYFYSVYFTGSPPASDTSELGFNKFQSDPEEMPPYWQLSSKYLIINTGLLGLNDSWIIGLEVGGANINDTPFNFAIRGVYNFPGWNTTDNDFDYSEDGTKRLSQSEAASLNNDITFYDFISSTHSYADAESDTIASGFALKLGTALILEINTGGLPAFKIEYITLYGPTGTVPLPPDPVKEGHTFAGWYWDEELTIPYAGEPIFEDSILYAKFTVNQYSVYFDAQGGSKIAPITTDYNTTITEPAPPVRMGYNFAGWYLDEDLTEPFDFNTPITSDITLYAKWTLQTRTVVFIVDNTEYVAVEVPYGSILINDTTAAQYVAAMGKLYTDAEKKICLI